MKFFPPSKTASSAPNLAMEIYKASRIGQRVLIVDDDNLMRDIVMTMPEKMACEVVMVNTAGDAKTLMINQDGTPFNVIVLDVGITNGDGIQLYQWIRDKFPTLQTYFVTGYPKQDVEKKVREIGSAPVIEKTGKVYSFAFWEDLFSTYFKIAFRRPSPAPNP